MKKYILLLILLIICGGVGFIVGNIVGEKYFSPPVATPCQHEWTNTLVFNIEGNIFESRLKCKKCGKIQ